MNQAGVEPRSAHPTPGGRLSRVLLACAWALLTASAVGCGGDKEAPKETPPPPSPNPPPSSGPIAIQGNERLAWDQPLASGTTVADYTFILYVDGNVGTITGVTCGNASGSTFTCNGRLSGLTPGTHYLQVAAVLTGRESTPSAYLAVSVGRSTTTDAAPPDTSTVVQCPTPTALCFDVEQAWRWDLPVSVPRVTPDGRALFIEGQRAVRALAGGIPTEEPALTVQGTTRRLVDLVVDRDYSMTRAVYLLWVDDSGASPTVNISRLRDVGGTLGEESVVVSGLPASANADPLLTQDGSGLLYIASGAAILRFTTEGNLPWQTGQTTPSWRDGLLRPTAIAIDEFNERLWLGGVDGRNQPQLLSVDLAADASSRMPQTRLANPRSGVPLVDDVVGIAASRQNGRGAPARLLLAHEHGGLWASATGTAADLQEIAFSLGRATAVSAGLAGDFYVVATAAESGPNRYVLAHLVPRTPAPLSLR